MSRPPIAEMLAATVRQFVGDDLPVRIRAWDGSEAGPAPSPNGEQADFHCGKSAILHTLCGQKRMFKRDSVRQQRDVAREPSVVLPSEPALPKIRA